MFAALLLSASLSIAGDCGDCAQGRQGLFARRTTSKQAVKTITSGPVKKTITIVPVGSAKSVVAPATSK
jgi:hypothetical protein